MTRKRLDWLMQHGGNARQRRITRRAVMLGFQRAVDDVNGSAPPSLRVRHHVLHPLRVSRFGAKT